ncbi:MAG TPA: BMC domain-containing protein [Humisphaera sp.]|nr:BMC domain-containing protein [Humisphaera sp.]
MTPALGILEISSWSAAMAATDAAAKAAPVTVVQAELNDFYGVVIKLAGDTAAVKAAVAAGVEMAQRMRVQCVSDVIPAPDDAARRVWLAPAEFNPLIEQDVIHYPNQQEHNVSEQAPYAIGMIETQGFTAVIEAIDTACKAASVEVIGKEKLGGGYVTVLIKGDVAAVRAAIDAGKAKVEGLGKLIASHVIPRPSSAVLGLLPK